MIPAFVGCTVVGTLAATTGVAPSLLIGAAFIAAIRRAIGGTPEVRLPGTKTLLVSITGLVILLIYLNRTAPAELSRPSRLLGTAIVTLGFVPFVVWIQRRELPIPLFPAITGIYVIYFGIPV